VLCYILSHVNAIGVPYAKLALLRIVEGVSDLSKAQVLLPMIQELVKEGSDMTELEARFGPLAEQFLALAMSSFDVSTSGDLNESSSSLWPVFIQSLRHCFLHGMFPFLILCLAC